MPRYAKKPESGSPPCAFALVVDSVTSLALADGYVPVDESVTPMTHHFAAGWSIAARTAFPDPDKTAIVASGTDAATWTGLPEGTGVTVDRLDAGVRMGAAVDASGQFALDVDAPGAYLVRMQHDTRILQEWIIVAT